jgi:hypothetical protein
LIWKTCKKGKFNSEMIWKIWKKIVKRYEKYRRKLWNDMENAEENSEKFRKYGRKISWIVVLSSIFSIWYHISNCLSSIFFISFHISTYFSSIYSISKIVKNFENMEER